MKKAHHSHPSKDHGHSSAVKPHHADTSDAQIVSTEYTQDDLAQLLYMLEEEKLAGDVYEALYEQTGIKTLNQIAASEDKHFDSLLTQAEQLGLSVDGILALPEGQYTDPALQALFDNLMLSASPSTTAALEVGVAIEATDIADLQAASDGLDGTLLGDVYDQLLLGSINHLNTFESLLA